MAAESERRRRKFESREQRVERVRAALLRDGAPRLLMSLILLATGAAGFLASFALLHAGLWRMWLRYPLAVLFAYGVFVLLLRLWLRYRRDSLAGDVPDLDLSAVDLTPDFTGVPGGAPACGADAAFGGGGDFGGGGASGAWGGGAQSAVSVSEPAGGGASSGFLDKLDFAGDADEGCVFFLLAVALIVAGVAASLYVVYAAPTLLAEILVDSLLVSGLYKSMKKAGRGDWLGAVVRRTWIPVLLTLVLFSAAGYFLQRAAPRARTMGEAWKAVSAD